MVADTETNTDPDLVTDIGRGIDLPPKAAYFAPYCNTPPLPRPEPPPFDPAECGRRLSRVRERDYHNPDWAEAEVTPVLSPAETNFWLSAVAKWCDSFNPATIPSQLKTTPYPAEIDPTRVTAIVQMQQKRNVPRELAGVLANVYGPVGFLTRLAAGEFRAVQTHYGYRSQSELNLMQGAWEHVRPYLTAAEQAAVREAVRPQLDPTTWPKKYDDPNPSAYQVAALVGLHDDIRELVRGWDLSPNNPTRYAYANFSPLLVLLGLRDPALVESTARGLGLWLYGSFHFQAWFAHTGLLGVAYAAEVISRHRHYNRQQLDELARVKDPALAPHMLAIRVRSRTPGLARAWLDTNIGSAVAGLLPLAAGKDKIALAALDYLRDTAKRGYGWVIERELATADPHIVAKVRRAVLDRPERSVPEFEPESLPKWLAEATAPAKKLPDWLLPEALPPLRVGDFRIPTKQVTLLLLELCAVQATKDDLFGNPAPLADAVCKHATIDSRDAFALALLNRWLDAKAPAADQWVLAAGGRLGDNATAAALVPRLKRWPGGASLKRFRDALAALRHIGTPFSLGQLAHLAETLRSLRAQQIARDELARLADGRGLTPEQLEDRSTPDLDLAQGGPTFDYGPRQFRLVLAGNLRPMARDAKGKLFHTLPTPRKTDDTLLVAEAKEAFRHAKAQTAEVLASVCHRLERGLVNGRRWTLDDFEQYLVRHPVAGAVVRRLVWGWYGVDGSLTGTFRMTEEGESVDADDRPANANAFQVGLVHPVQLVEATRQAWAARFADYELISPFPQLTRPVYELTDEETEAVVTPRFDFKVTQAQPVHRLAKEQGWFRRNDEAQRPFPAANVTAVVRWQGWGPVSIGACRFYPSKPGVVRFQDETAIPLGRVDAIVLCEAFANLEHWARTAK